MRCQVSSDLDSRPGGSAVVTMMGKPIVLSRDHSSGRFRAFECLDARDFTAGAELPAGERAGLLFVVPTPDQVK